MAAEIITDPKKTNRITEIEEEIGGIENEQKKLWEKNREFQARKDKLFEELCSLWE